MQEQSMSSRWELYWEFLGIENHGEVYQGEEFQEEMLVLHGFDGSKLQKFLIALQRVGVGRIELKAMITGK